MLNYDDLETVKAAAPAYLLLLDGMLEQRPDNVPLLRSASNLYSVYATLAAEDEPRAQRFTTKAFDYARHAFCLEHDFGCNPTGQPFATFQASLAALNQQALAGLFNFGTAWAGWIQAHPGDWNALAQLPRVQAIMERMLELDEAYRQGAAHLYLGLLHSLIPAQLGGHPEQGRQHFERAIILSSGRNLMAKVLFAQYYARAQFDRPLHDQLLNEVLSAKAQAPDLTLINTLAQHRARQLLEESDDYF